MLTSVADEKDFPPLRTTRQHSITSRISLDESRRSTPPIPPGFEAHVANESRRSTPTVPPGLGKPSALPDLDGGSSSRPTSRPASRASLRRTTSQILPALPLRPGTPARRSNLEEARAEPHETPTKASKTTQLSDTKNIMNTEVSPNRGTASAQTSVKESDAVQQVNAASAPGKAPQRKPDTSASEKAVAVPQPRGAPQPNDRPATQESQAASSVPEADSADVPLEVHKRKHPGKLDITAATSKQDIVASSIQTPTDTTTPSKSSRAASLAQSTSTKPLESPMASPVVKAAPRTLRVVQTPKTEGAPSTPLAASPLPAAVANRVPSRQASVASIQVPGTPSSEQVSISDNISMASTSQSRANSPPPAVSKVVGTAPLRAKTKNQMKKERQERAKALEEEKAKIEEVVKPAEEPAQEAIVSRKKKTKKEKEPKAKPKAVPPPPPPQESVTPSASQSPASKAKPKPTLPPEVPKPEVVQADVKPSKPHTPTKAAPNPPPPPPPPPPPVQSPHGPSPPPTPTPTAAQLISDLKARAPEIQKCIESLFRVSSSIHFKPSQNISAKDLGNPTNWKADHKLSLSKEEVDALLKGTLPSIHYGGEDGRIWDRGMVTPSGAHLRALTTELESRFLELEKALREMPDEFSFRPSKPQNDMKFPSVDLEALKRQFENSGGRGVSVMEQMVQDGSTMKKGAFLVDEASKYINEFVMPPATPPPSSGNNGRGQGTTGSTHSTPMIEQAVQSLEIAERCLNEAKRLAEEKENALKKILKKNKRLFGLS